MSAREARGDEAADEGPWEVELPFTSEEASPEVEISQILTAPEVVIDLADESAGTDADDEPAERFFVAGLALLLQATVLALVAAAAWL